MLDAVAHLAELESIAEQTTALKARAQEILSELRPVLTERLTLQHKLFRPLAPAVKPQDIGAAGRITHVALAGDTLNAILGFYRRGEWEDYAIKIPLRYMRADGKELMEREAREMAEAQEAGKKAAAAEQEQRELAEYHRLIKKFGGPQCEVPDPAA